MSYPFRPSIQKFTFDHIIGYTRKVFRALPDHRTGEDCIYEMEDGALGAFSVFFTQSPSLLDSQRKMELAKGQSNANTLFGMLKIPSDPHIRNLLDPIPPSEFFQIYNYILDGLKELGYLEGYRSINGTLLMPMDGTQYFSSNKIHCKNCTVKHHKNGTVSYSHTVITPVITGPGTNTVFPLEPEFILPQDGHDKQDCENAAAKRWLDKYASRYASWDITLLGDDLYAKQPLCEAILDEELNFILVCKPSSHKTVYKWVAELEAIGGVKTVTVTVTRRKGKKVETDTYRYVNQVPLRDGEDALKVNWCELTTRNAEGKIVFKNAFVTNHEISEENVVEMVSAGRARWKVENENNNVLKTKGYHLAHNFGHGQENLSMVLVTLNLLAFLIHTVLDLMDSKYQLVRQKLGTRKNFFNDVRALTRYICFDGWDAMLNFMMRGLEIEPPDTG